MKLIHLSDLHLGKRVNEFSMLEDQEYILTRILDIVDAEQPDALVIAGDVYDKTVPSAEAVALLDDFLVRLADREIVVLVISGNHDSPERIAFASRLIEASGVHLSPVYDGRVEAITLSDEYGLVDFFLLPFVKPAHVRRFFPQARLDTYTDAISCAIEHMQIVPNRRSVLVTHQFVTGAERCQSEELSIGGSDNVDAAVFAPFDYVALGHIHGPQNIAGPRVRYCGTPLKYSFSEVRHQKSVTVAELREKGNLLVRTVPLEPRQDMLELRGSYLEVTAREFYQNLDRQAYYHITLTDEQDVPDAIGKLRAVYPNLMKLDYDNCRTRSTGAVLDAGPAKPQSPLMLFSEFYRQQNNQAVSQEQMDYLAALVEEIWEEDV